jgi:hypothetical protein
MNTVRLARQIARRANVGRVRRDGQLERSTVWLLGSPRTGSTWVLNLLRLDGRVVSADEPGIGSHLGLFAADVMGIHPAGFEPTQQLLNIVRANDPNYFFSSGTRDVWEPPLRRLLLDRIGAYVAARPSGAADETVVVIKEPAGSQAAELLLSVLPKSRLLFLMRDGRDVIDSELDAVQKDGWLARQFGSTDELVGREREAFVRGQAHRWVARTEAAQRAFEHHAPELRMLVRYEDLRADPATGLRAMVDWLGLAVEDRDVIRRAERLSFDAIPTEKTGKGKFARAAAPGLWRENLPPEEHVILNEIMGDTLAAFGYDVP